MSNKLLPLTDAQYCPAPGYLVNGNSPIPDSYLTCSSEWSPGAKPYDTHGPERARLTYNCIYYI
ncbi:hypothetical protein DPMN_076743 [Dreissena polymorpha]|uniref:Uncharacterized protein n=1 Tax=Dreissena polymorpha TaxID=45954 RepID=A0A9D4BNN3_DREPO|nr:hypothetical protein DPMN_076743 [Dreissena polymorpha]